MRPTEEAMDHPRIEQEKIIDRYLAGELSPEDEESFEVHLFACPACLEQTQAGEDLRLGLRAVAAEEGARAAQAQLAAQGLVALGLMAWWRRAQLGRRAGFVALALAALSLPVLLVRQQLELSRLRAGGTSIGASAGGGLAAPTSALQVVSLGPVRSAREEPLEIQPEPGKEALLLSLELPSTRAGRYRATLSEAGGRALWTGSDLEPNLYGTLLVALPSAYLSPGDYRVTLEGRSATGPEPPAEIRFRIVAAP